MNRKFWFALQRLYEIMRGYKISNWSQLYQESGNWTAEQIQSFQQERLGEQLRHACDRIPYYRKLEDSGQLPLNSSSSEEWLTQFPLMSKKDYQRFPSDFHLQADMSQHTSNQTGGSTGEVLDFYQDKTYMSASWASQRYFNSWSGYVPGSKWASIWGAAIEDKQQQKVRTRLAKLIYHQLFISTFDLKPDSIRQKIETIVNFKPKIVHGFPSAMETFARYILNNDLQIDFLVGVMTSAETLQPDQRELIEKAFRAPVYNRYGSREFSSLAMECSAHSGLHLDEIRNYFEFLPVSDGLAEIVVTQLTNQAMPLIRYRTGDIARLSDKDSSVEYCSCGSALSKVAGIEGRTWDLIRGKSGEVITGTFWRLLRSRPGTVQFQVHQRNLEQIEINLLTNEQWQPENEEYYRQMTQSQFQDPVTIRFNYPDEIPASASGKHRFVISDVGAEG
jgi:phenylacetate-CoA ligase